MKHLLPCTCFFLVSLGVAAESRILFVSDGESGSGHFDLYSMRADGTDLRRLTATVGSEWAPAIAPDGRRVAFVDATAEAPNMRIMDLETGGVEEVPGRRALAVNWVDGDTLLYLAEMEHAWAAQFEIVQRDLASGAETVLFGESYTVYPTGGDSLEVDRAAGRVFFTSFLPGHFKAVMHHGPVDGSEAPGVFAACEDEPAHEEQNEGPVLGDHYDLVPSPDGTKIAYAADHRSGWHRLYVRDRGDECGSQLRLSDVYCGDPAWSPDSQWLVFTRAGESTFGMEPYIGDLIRINVDGTGEVNLTAGLGALAGRCAHAAVYEEAAGTPCEPFLIVDVTRTPDGDVVFAWEAGDGIRYQVEHSSDLRTWADDLPDSLRGPADAGTILTFTDVAPTPAHRFYRVKALCP